jgi:phytanoyl-CoA dioxygenase PhyH
MSSRPSVETGLVTTEQREAFDRDGYLVIDPGVPEELLDAIAEEMDGLYSLEPTLIEGAFYEWSRILDGWRRHGPVKALAVWPQVLAVLEDLYGRKPLPFQTLNFRMGTEQRAHSDTIHFDCKPPGYMCGVWTALEDIDEDNGPLVYYPGSHKLPQYTMQDAGLEPGEPQIPAYEQFVQDVIDREGLQPAYGTIRKGQSLIWAANLLHGGAPQKDKSRTRQSQVSHYYFESCKYWTPLLSGETNVHWRDPEWIT